MEEPAFDPQLHIKYWQRCLKSLLPNAYQSNDSSRMALAFFILSALDILGAGADTLPLEEVSSYREWILGCQHPSGGFCGSPTHKYPDSYYHYDESKEIDMDPPNIAATYFAILSLNYTGGLGEVKRTRCLRYLKKLQREDGSFGEILGQNGKVEGGRDMRYCHFASTIRWVLRGDEEPPEGDHYADIDVEKLVQHIRSGETYDGGIGESSEHEAHAGYTYCAIATLSSLGRLPESISRKSLGSNLVQQSDTVQRGITNLPGVIQWLMSRQLAFADDDPEDDDGYNSGHPLAGVRDAPNHEDHPDYNVSSLAKLTLDEPQSIAFNGRPNKPADTCYSWWSAASLEILGQRKLINKDLTRRFLLKQTQHRIGGFGKEPGHPPDLYHSYLGLATLAMMKEAGLKEVDPVLPGVSEEAKERFEKGLHLVSTPYRYYWKNEKISFCSETEPDHAEKMAAAEGPPKYLVDLMRRIVDREKQMLDPKPSVAAALLGQ